MNDLTSSDSDVPSNQVRAIVYVEDVLRSSENQIDLNWTDHETVTQNFIRPTSWTLGLSKEIHNDNINRQNLRMGGKKRKKKAFDPAKLTSSTCSLSLNVTPGRKNELNNEWGLTTAIRPADWAKLGGGEGGGIRQVVWYGRIHTVPLTMPSRNRSRWKNRTDTRWTVTTTCQCLLRSASSFDWTIGLC